MDPNEQTQDPEPDPEFDGPSPPEPSPLATHAWPEQEGLVAFRIAWWERHTDGLQTTSYHRLSASVDGVHEPSLWPRRSWRALDTTVVGRPGEHGEKGDVATLAHRFSRDEVIRLAKRLTDEGFLAGRGSHPLDPGDEDFSEGTLPGSGWQVILFIGDVPGAKEPTAMRAERYVGSRAGLTVRDDDILDILSDVMRVHESFWNFAHPTPDESATLLHRRPAAEWLTWLALALTIAAGLFLVWPLNSPYLSGECLPKVGPDEPCPVEWDRVTTSEIPGALMQTGVLVAFILFPLLHRRWYARLIAAVPLTALGILGLLVFGPIYVPAMLAMLAATACSRT